MHESDSDDDEEEDVEEDVEEVVEVEDMVQVEVEDTVEDTVEVLNALHNHSSAVVRDSDSDNDHSHSHRDIRGHSDRHSHSHSRGQITSQNDLDDNDLDEEILDKIRLSNTQLHPPPPYTQSQLPPLKGSFHLKSRKNSFKSRNSFTAQQTPVSYDSLFDTSDIPTLNSENATFNSQKSRNNSQKSSFPAEKLSFSHSPYDVSVHWQITITNGLNSSSEGLMGDIDSAGYKVKKSTFLDGCDEVELSHIQYLAATRGSWEEAIGE